MGWLISDKVETNFELVYVPLILHDTPCIDR